MIKKVLSTIGIAVVASLLLVACDETAGRGPDGNGKD